MEWSDPQQCRQHRWGSPSGKVSITSTGREALEEPSHAGGQSVVALWPFLFWRIRSSEGFGKSPCSDEIANRPVHRAGFRCCVSGFPCSIEVKLEFSWKTMGGIAFFNCNIVFWWTFYRKHPCGPTIFKTFPKMQYALSCWMLYGIPLSLSQTGAVSTNSPQKVSLIVRDSSTHQRDQFRIHWYEKNNILK